MGTESLFDSFNSYDKTLYVLESDSAEGLREQIIAIRLPTRILTIYAMGETHFAWIQTTAKIKKNRR
jgi:hypothetical protein